MSLPYQAPQQTQQKDLTVPVLQLLQLGPLGSCPCGRCQPVTTQVYTHHEAFLKSCVAIECRPLSGAGEALRDCLVGLPPPQETER